MKTTLDLPTELLDTAMSVGNCRTKTATIVMALEQMIRTARLAQLRKYRGSIPKFDIDLDVSRDRK